MSTHELFSKVAQDYARFRPGYPGDLFGYLAGLVSSHAVAWDCATGNGQAALELAKHFDIVLASDLSVAQLSVAFRHDTIHYLLARAESCPVPTASVGIVTVAQALHWFDLTDFYIEVRRVLKPGGIFAAWSYLLVQTDPAIQRIAETLYYRILGPYWSPKMRMIEEKYETILFPFQEITAPHFEMEANWNLDQFMGFLASWSAISKFVEVNGYIPLEEIREGLIEAWGEPSQKRVMHWPIYLRIGRPIR